MSMVCLLSALHGLRSAMIGCGAIYHEDNLRIVLPTERAGILFEFHVKHNATPAMASCLSDLFKDHADATRSVTIEGVTIAWPVEQYAEPPEF